MVFLLLFENSIQPISTPGILYPKQQVELITLIDLLKFSSSTAVLNLVQLYHAANFYISKRCILQPTELQRNGLRVRAILNRRERMPLSFSKAGNAARRQVVVGIFFPLISALVCVAVQAE